MARPLVTTSREALKLYRDIIRACKRFTWRNEKGEVWGNVLKRSARKEFEAGRHEMDHAIILKLLITGRTALQQAEEAMEKRRATLLEERSQKKV